MFAERWFAGTYVVSGTFFLDGAAVTSSHVESDIEPLYREVRRSKKAMWPRGLAGFFVIPIYCAAGFDDEIRGWIRSRHSFAYAIWPEPLLYETSQNSVIFREDFGARGSAFYPYLSQLFGIGLNRAAAHFGHSSPPTRKKNA